MGLDIDVHVFTEKELEVKSTKPHFLESFKKQIKQGAVKDPFHLESGEGVEIFWSDSWAFLSYLKMRYGLHTDERFFVGQIKDVYNALCADIKRLEKNKTLLPQTSYRIYGFDFYKHTFEEWLQDKDGYDKIWKNLLTFQEALAEKMKNNRHDYVVMDMSC